MTAEQLAMFDPDACQRWHDGTPAWAPPGDIDPRRCVAARIDEATARRFVVRHQRAA